MNLLPSKIFLSLAAAMLLSGCVFSTRPGTATPVPEASSTPLPVATAAPLQPTAVPSPLPTAAAAATPTETSGGQAAAKKAAQDFASALEAGDYAAASKMVSTFSLTNSQMTSGDVQADLSARAAGGKWSGFEVKGTRVFDPQTILVEVAFQAPIQDVRTGKMSESAADELWPMRLENDAWRYNYLNLIDTRTLDVKEATYGGMTVKPLRMARYSDRLELSLLVQNATNEAIVWGWPSETVATFHFGSQTVEGEKNRLIFDSLRSYPDAVITVKGLYPAYPDSVELRKFKTAQQPWFNFQLTE